MGRKFCGSLESLGVKTGSCLRDFRRYEGPHLSRKGETLPSTSLQSEGETEV